MIHLSQLYLYVAIIGILLMIYGMTRKTQVAIKSPTIRDDGMLQSLQSFMDELEKSNLELIDTVQKLRRDLEHEIVNNRTRIEELEKANSNRMPSNEFVLSAPYQQAFQLSEEGLLPWQIAKKLGIGVGELEFALRLKREGNLT